MMICLLSASGRIGLSIVRDLSAGGHKVRAVTRSEVPNPDFDLPGVETVVGDFADENALPRILKDVDQLFLCTPNATDQLEVQNRIVDAAVDAKVKAIVKLSVFTAEENELCHFSRLHWQNDQRIKRSGIPFTLLYPNTFMQSLGLLFGAEIRARGTMSSAVGPDKTITMVDVRDVADVAAAVLAKNEHKGETLLIMGPTPISYSECAKHISERIGKPIEVRQISERESITQLLRAGVSDFMMEGIKDLYRMYDRNDINPMSDVTLKWTGKPARSFSDFLDDYHHLFA